MKLGIILTGGGSQLIPNLLTNGGASSYFSFAEVPYSKESVVKHLGEEPPKYANINVARQYAFNAASKLLKLHGPGEEYIGIGCSAKLMTDNEREGRENVGYFVVETIRPKTFGRKIEVGIEFNKNTSVIHRYEQEQVLAQVMEAFIWKNFDLVKRYFIDRWIKFNHLRWN